MDINKLSFSISGTMGKTSSSIDTLVKRLTVLDTSFTKIVQSGQTLNGVLTSLQTSFAGIASSSKSIKGVSTSLGAISTQAKKIGSSTKNISKVTPPIKEAKESTSKFKDAINQLNKSTQTSQSTLGKWLKRISQLTVAIMIIRKMTRAVIDGIQASISYTENLNLFTVALGENATRASAFVNQMGDSFHLDTAELTRTLGLFYQITTALGVVSDKSYTISTNLTKMAYDLASFYNITVDEAVIKLQAGLVGETEPLRRIGIIITENNLAETARNLGIKKSIRNMTEQEKIQLRYTTALLQTKNAQGDMARTMMQPQNMLRIFKEQLQILARNIGNSFIPMLQRLMPHIIAVTSALAKLAEQFAISIGYTSPEVLSISSGTGDIVSDAEDTEKSTSNIASNLAKILKYTRDINSATTGLDELNILSDEITSPNYTSLFDDMESSDYSQIDIPLFDYDNAISQTDKTIDILTEKYTKMFEDFKTKWDNIGLDTVFDSTKSAFKELFDTVFNPDGTMTTDTILTDIKGVLDVINDIATGVLQGIKDIYDWSVKIWTDALKPVIGWIAPEWLENIENGSFAESVEKIFKVFVAYKVLSSVVTLASKLPIIATNLGVISGLASAFTLIDWVIDIQEAEGNEKLLSDLKTKLIGAVTAGLGAGILTKSGTVGMITFLILMNAKWEKLEDIFAPIREQIKQFALDHPMVANWLNINTDNDTSLQKYRENMGIETDNSIIPSKEPLDLEGISPMSIDWKTDSNLVEVVEETVGTTFEENLKELKNNPLEISLSVSETVSEWLKNAEISIGNKFSNFNTMGMPMAFANGGVPEKGNLFVAGENGAELVTEHNGETVVMNEKQLAERGISLYASGVNVPKDNTPKYAGVYNPRDNTPKGTGGINNPIFSTTNIQKAIDLLLNSLTFLGDSTVKLVKNLGKTKVGKLVLNIGSWIKNAVLDIGIWVKAKSSILWEGIKKSKSLGWLADGLEFLGKNALAIGKVLGKGLLTASTALFQAFEANTSLVKYGSDEDKQAVAMDAIGGMLGDTGAGAIFGLLQQIESGTMGDFLNNLPNMVQAGLDALKGLLSGVAQALPEIMNGLPDIINDIVGFLTNTDTINSFVESLILIVSAIVEALPEIIQALIEALPTILKALIHGVVDNLDMFLVLGWNIGVAVLEGVAKIFAMGIDALISPIRGILKLFNLDIPKLADWVDFSSMYMSYATGGYPDTGQMFIAREAGAELVGNIGGRTAVANNDQIIEAISTAVYGAMVSAQSQQSQKQVVVNLDGRKISDNQRNVSSAIGLQFGMGGF